MAASFVMFYSITSMLVVLIGFLKVKWTIADARHQPFAEAENVSSV